MKLIKEKALPILMNALSEDVASGDITSGLLFEKDLYVMAEVVAREECVLAGIDIAKWVFNAIDEKIISRPLSKDGDHIKKGKRIISLKGSVKNILTSERTVLNFLGRLSGIATLTNKFVKKVKPRRIKIFDTRKTTPGLRVLEKYAVRVGGGHNHRMGLWDGVLIKDNHLDSLEFPSTSLRTGKAQSSKLAVIGEAVRVAKARGYKNVEIEVNNLKEFSEALNAGADIIMLDNMRIEDIRKAVRMKKNVGADLRVRPKVEGRHPLSPRLRRTGRGIVLRSFSARGGSAFGGSEGGHIGRPLLEVSGGVTLENVAKVANTGIDRISIGCVTHSAPSIDFSLEICK